MLTCEEIREHFNHCDAFANSLEIELLEVSEDYGVATMPLGERQRNGMGKAHGGAIFALVDMTFAAACCARGVYCVNTQTSLSFLTAGVKGPLRGEAHKLRAGKHLGVYDVRVTDVDGTLVAAATVTGYFTNAVIPA